MSSRDISEAMAYERLQPFGDARADYRAATVAHTVAISQGMKAEGGRRLEVSDFMPRFGEKPKTMGDKVKEVFSQWLR